jgi:hypothetical protein
VIRLDFKFKLPDLLLKSLESLLPSLVATEFKHAFQRQCIANPVKILHLRPHSEHIFGIIICQLMPFGHALLELVRSELE